MAQRKRPEGYHHGQLPEALLEASLAVLTKRGLAAFSLREVAREAGVTSGAPYHHFEDRAHLLAVLAEQGFERLAEALQAAAGQGREHPGDRMRAMVLAYLDFARSNAIRYSVMYVPEIADRKRFASLHEHAWGGLGAFRDVLAEALPDLPKAQLLARAASAWAACHGLASLVVGGVVANRPELPTFKALAHSLAEQVALGSLKRD